MAAAALAGVILRLVVQRLAVQRLVVVQQARRRAQEEARWVQKVLVEAAASLLLVARPVARLQKHGACHHVPKRKTLGLRWAA